MSDPRGGVKRNLSEISEIKDVWSPGNRGRVAPGIAPLGSRRSGLSMQTSGPEMAPDLAAVVAAWPELPEAIKAGIVAMVKAASLER